MNFYSKVNIIPLGFAAKIALILRSTNVNFEKIDDLLLETYGIVLAVFGLRSFWKSLIF